MTTSENLPGSHAALNHPPTENVAAEPRQADPMHGKPSEVFQTFIKIGLTAFGGPIAHLGYFEREIIERRNWLPQNAYGDLLANCNSNFLADELGRFADNSWQRPGRGQH